MSATEMESAGAAAEAYTPFTPFQESYAFEPEVSTLAQAEAGPVVSPFIGEYAQLDDAVGPEAQELQELLLELFDPEFDELLGEMAQEAWSAATDRAEELGETLAAGTAEQFLEEWIRPVREQGETLLENIAHAAAEHDVASLTEPQLEEMFEQFEPSGSGLEPHFEDFLGKLVKKAKTLVKGAVGLAKRGLMMLPGISALLRKLKALVKPLLQRVLKLGLDKLPPQLRPVARQLARRILGAQAAGTATEALDEQPALPDVGSIQAQFDLDSAALLFAAEEAEQEVLVGEVRGEVERANGSPISELQEARARLVDELTQRADLEDSLQNFIPAVMAVLPIARTAIGVVGRPRVVGFLAKYLANLLQRYVPPEAAQQLSKAIVDAGLRMLSLEAPAPTEAERLAPSAIAGAVEDTVRRVAQLDESTLDQPALFEAAVAEAFQQAAAENFPPELLIPELHEASVSATWVSLPLNQRRKQYKKYTHVFEAEITPQMAAAIKTFRGTTLAAFLKDQLGLVPPMRARVHLYQATSGTSLAHIARYETTVAGLGTAARSASSQLHPLTPDAAGILLREPKLARAVPARFLSSPAVIAVGQRFYYLELPGTGRATPMTGAGPGARPGVIRSSQVNVKLDLPGNQFRLFAFLSEADAQEVAAKVRGSDLTSALALARRNYEAGVQTALGSQFLRQVKINTGRVSLQQPANERLKLISQTVRETLARKLVAWTGKALAEYLQARGGELVAATEDPHAGVTMIVTMSGPPGAGAIRSLVGGGGLDAVADLDSLLRGDPKLSVQTVPGFRFG